MPEREVIDTYTLYRPTEEMPESFFLLRFVVVPGSLEPVRDMRFFMMSPDVHLLRHFMEFTMSKARLMRDPGDGPDVIESYV